MSCLKEINSPDDYLNKEKQLTHFTAASVANVPSSSFNQDKVLFHSSCFHPIYLTSSIPINCVCKMFDMDSENLHVFSQKRITFRQCCPILCMHLNATLVILRRRTINGGGKGFAPWDQT